MNIDYFRNITNKNFNIVLSIWNFWHPINIFDDFMRTVVIVEMGFILNKSCWDAISLHIYDVDWIANVSIIKLTYKFGTFPKTFRCPNEKRCIQLHWMKLFISCENVLRFVLFLINKINLMWTKFFAYQKLHQNQQFNFWL